MDRLKNLKAVSWAAIDKQANDIVNLVTHANSEQKNSVEYSGVIHNVNLDILQTNGFSVSIVSPGKYYISWKLPLDSYESDEESVVESNGPEQQCPCPCPQNQNKDPLEMLMLAALNTLMKNKK